MLMALVRKDIRLCRLPILVGITLMIAAFAIGLTLVASTSLWQDANSATLWAVVLGTAAHFGVILSLGILPVLSGMMIATERANRSSEFLAYLPPSRGAILCSKLIVLFGFIIFSWGGSLDVGLLADWLAGDSETARMFTSLDIPPWYFPALGLSYVGVGWCASAFLENTGPPVALAFVSPIAVASLLAGFRYAIGWPDEDIFEQTFLAGCGIIGVVPFVIGTAYFLHRIEP